MLHRLVGVAQLKDKPQTMTQKSVSQLLDTLRFDPLSLSYDDWEQILRSSINTELTQTINQQSIVANVALLDTLERIPLLGWATLEGIRKCRHPIANEGTSHDIIDSAERQGKSARGTIEALEAVFSPASQEHTWLSLLKQSQDLSQELDALRREVEEGDSILGRRVTEAQAIERLEKRRQLNDSKLATLSAYDLDSTTQEIERLEQTVRKLSEEIDRANIDLEQLRKQHKDVAEEHLKTSNCVIETRNTIATLTKSKHKLDKELKDNNSRLKSLPQEIELVDKDCKTLDAQCKRLEEDLKARRKQASKRRNELGQLRASSHDPTQPSARPSGGATPNSHTPALSLDAIQKRLHQYVPEPTQKVKMKIAPQTLEILKCFHLDERATVQIARTMKTCAKKLGFNELSILAPGLLPHYILKKTPGPSNLREKGEFSPLNSLLYRFGEELESATKTWSAGLKPELPPSALLWIQGSDPYTLISEFEHIGYVARHKTIPESVEPQDVALALAKRHDIQAKQEPAARYAYLMNLGGDNWLLALTASSSLPNHPPWGPNAQGKGVQCHVSLYDELILTKYYCTFNMRLTTS